MHRALIGVILLSVAAAVTDTLPGTSRAWDLALVLIEVVCVGLFTVEYIARVWIAVEDRAGRYDQPFWGRLRYMATPMAIIDLLAILPTYLSVLLPGDFLLLRTLPPRYTVIRRGEHPESMFFIDDGRVVVRHQERRISLSAGSFFGEMALLEGRPRQVSVITLTTCRLLELQAGDFHRLLAGDPQLRQTILDEVGRRTEARPVTLSVEEP